MPRQAGRLAAVARYASDQGVPVDWEAGWRTRGRTAFAPRGFTVHHDASPRGSNARRIIRDGHGSLPGPLAHLYLQRDGTLVVIAAGCANHAGRGGWRGLRGNSTVWGLEIANDGSGEPYTSGQLHVVRLLVAAFVEVDGIDPQLVHAHHEWAPRRKIDPAVDPDAGSGSWRMSPWRDLTASHPDPEPDRPEEYAMKRGDTDSDLGYPVVSHWQHLCNRFLYETTWMVETHGVKVIDDLGGKSYRRDGIAGSNLSVDGEFGAKTQRATWAVRQRAGLILGYSLPGQHDVVTPTTQGMAASALAVYRHADAA